MEEQLKFFGLDRKRETQPVSDDVVRMQPTKLAAIKLSVQVSGLEEKEVYIPLGIDKATWSKIMSGLLNFPTNAEEKFMDLVGNEILLTWLNYRRGYRMVALQDAKDKEITALKSENSELKNENKLMRELLTRRA